MLIFQNSILVSTCSEQHVRTWTVTRFREMISTYPGATVLASFTLVDLERSNNENPSQEFLNEMTFRYVCYIQKIPSPHSSFQRCE